MNMLRVCEATLGGSTLCTREVGARPVDCHVGLPWLCAVTRALQWGCEGAAARADSRTPCCTNRCCRSISIVELSACSKGTDLRYARHPAILVVWLPGPSKTT